ncbi:DUF3500 domain-containing protein [uncultured Paludibaculum sp.]|uniref:DUF3500 domain-containing protein n=1 Tax=uncultured Paludibaculum sp. TaxID=1765020 RepID=UPI002AAB4481|nr:DUF3500 domain-containing protein [uncultured Paludibaculum sp.]
MRFWAAFPLLLVASLVWAHDDHALPRMVSTARNFLASLTPEQRAAVVFPFEDDERFFWHYIPSADIPKRYERPRKGLTLSEMSPHQKALASALLSAGLSQQGFIKTTTIMSLEDILRIMEKDTAGRRNPERYHFSIFGEPSATGTWAYRIEGHHVSLHFTVVKGKATGNPTFLGSNPGEVKEGPRAGLRVLGAEEDKGRALMTALSPDQRKVALVAEKAYADILTERSRKAALTGQPSGLIESKMTADQRKLLATLIDEYIENLPGELAEQRRQRVKEAGQTVYFAWAGEVEKGRPHYYRVQSPTFLIEYDNTQNNANHIHSVWRDFEDDFGVDLLKEHYASAAKEHGHDPHH